MEFHVDIIAAWRWEHFAANFTSLWLTAVWACARRWVRSRHCWCLRFNRRWWSRMNDSVMLRLKGCSRIAMKGLLSLWRWWWWWRVDYLRLDVDEIWHQIFIYLLWLGDIAGELLGDFREICDDWQTTHDIQFCVGANLVLVNLNGGLLLLLLHVIVWVSLIMSMLKNCSGDLLLVGHVWRVHICHLLLVELHRLGFDLIEHFAALDFFVQSNLMSSWSWSGDCDVLHFIHCISVCRERIMLSDKFQNCTYCTFQTTQTISFIDTTEQFCRVIKVDE